MPRPKSANYFTSKYIRQNHLNRHCNDTKFATHLIVLSSVDFSHTNIISNFTLTLILSHQGRGIFYHIIQLTLVLPRLPQRSFPSLRLKKSELYSSISPASAKLKYLFSPIMMWSKTLICIIFPAKTKSWVICLSLSLG